MFSELPIEEDEHEGYCTINSYEISDTGECKKFCKGISIKFLPDDI